MENNLLLIIAGLSIGYNILQRFDLKREKRQREREYECYLADDKWHRKEKSELKITNELNSEIIQSLERVLKEAETKNTEFKYNANKKYDDLDYRFNLMIDLKKDLIRQLTELEKSHKKLEVELYNLDWAYDELMKAYNSNALDLYFWNLLRSADRETRRKFIKSGKYRVCSLEDGRVMFEVI